MGIVDTRDALVLPHLAETHLIVQQTQLLDDIVHDQVDVYLRLISHTFLVCFTQLANLRDIESLIRVKFKHAHDYASQLW